MLAMCSGCDKWHTARHNESFSRLLFHRLLSGMILGGAASLGLTHFLFSHMVRDAETGLRALAICCHRFHDVILLWDPARNPTAPDAL
jgi:hypothetical protein